MNSAAIAMHVAYWVENRHLPFPQCAIGTHAWAGRHDLGIVLGGRRDDCLVLLVTTTGEWTARHATQFFAAVAS